MTNTDKDGTRRITQPFATVQAKKWCKCRSEDSSENDQRIAAKTEGGTGVMH